MVTRFYNRLQPCQYRTGTEAYLVRYLNSPKMLASHLMSPLPYLSAILLAAAPLGAGLSSSPAGTTPLAVAPQATDSLRLPRLFADGMVLQRDRPIVVWGWAQP